jgi:hypothetical protein
LPELETENPENDTQDLAADIQHTSEQKGKIADIPGFEVIYCIIALIVVLLYKRK